MHAKLGSRYDEQDMTVVTWTDQVAPRGMLEECVSMKANQSSEGGWGSSW
jgi:hypothetical protein